MSDLQVRFSRLWTQCQRCQGSLHQVRRFLIYFFFSYASIETGTAHPGRPVQLPRLSYLLHAEEIPKGCGGRVCCAGAIRPRAVVDHVARRDIYDLFSVYLGTSCVTSNCIRANHDGRDDLPVEVCSRLLTSPTSRCAATDEGPRCAVRHTYKTIRLDCLALFHSRSPSPPPCVPEER